MLNFILQVLIVSLYQVKEEKKTKTKWDVYDLVVCEQVASFILLVNFVF